MPYKRPPSKGLILSPLFSLIAGPAGTANVHRTRRGDRFAAAPRPIRKSYGGSAPPPAEESCPCKRFKILDVLWRQKTPAEKAAWNNAVKKHHMSGYELWMKESLTLCANCGMLPAGPSVSGGYSTSYLEASDDEVPPPGDWIGKAPPTPPPPPTWPIGGQCDSCSESYTPQYYRCDISGCSDSAAWLNGPWLLTQDPEFWCAWTLDVSPERAMFLDRTMSSEQSLFLYELYVGSMTLWHDGPAHNCLLTIPLSFDSGDGQWTEQYNAKADIYPTAPP